MAALDETLAAQAGAQFGVPPAIIYALGLHETNFGATKGDGVGMFDLPPAVIRTMGYDPTEVAGNPQLQTVLTARYLSELFAQTGDWSQTLSMYQGGTAQDAASPTSAIGGSVNAILGIAGSRPTYGQMPMGSFKPADPAKYIAAADNFTTHMHGMTALGGVITQDSIDQFLQCTQYVWDTTPWVKQMGSYGNAADWGAEAKKAGLQEGNTPQPGAVVYWGAGQGGAGSAGHVAKVEKVNPDGTFTVTEGNWPEGSKPVHGRVVGPGDVAGFIYPPAGQADAFIASVKTGTPAGATPGPPPPQPKEAAPKKAAKDPTPAAIADFAARAKALGLTAQTISDNMPHLSSLRQRYLNKETSLADLAHHIGQSPAEMNAAIRAMPSPHYPEINAGDFLDGWNHASLYSLATQRRYPTLGEAQRFVAGKLNPQQIHSYYQNQGDTPQPQPQPKPPTANEPPPDPQAGSRGKF